MASRLPKPVTSTATMTTRATRSKTVTPSDPAPATATRTTRAAAMKPRDPPAPAKKTATRKTTKTATKDGEGSFDPDTVATKKEPAATSKQLNGSQPVVVPPDHDIEPIKVSTLRIRSHLAAQVSASGIPSYSPPDKSRYSHRQTISRTTVRFISADGGSCRTLSEPITIPPFDRPANLYLFVLSHIPPCHAPIRLLHEDHVASRSGPAARPECPAVHLRCYKLWKDIHRTRGQRSFRGRYPAQDTGRNLQQCWSVAER